MEKPESHCFPILWVDVIDLDVEDCCANTALIVFLGFSVHLDYFSGHGEQKKGARSIL